MRVRIALENGIENRSLAWALDYPGCFSYGIEASEAILRFPQALLRYKEWVDSHTADSWLADLQDFDIHLQDTFEVTRINRSFDPDTEGIEINAWFLYDWKPLTEEELRRGLLILSWSREDLLELVASLNADQMTRKFPGERWSIQGVLRHIANAEHWYMDRLSLAGCSREKLPEDVFLRLLFVRERLAEVLPGLAEINDVHGVDGEFWSPRKLLRRAAWHEIDHVEHIFKLIALLKKESALLMKA